jgi:hypothetical protein
MAGLKSLGYLIVRRRQENTGKLLTAPGLVEGVYKCRQEDRCLSCSSHVVGALGHAYVRDLLLGRGC